MINLGTINFDFCAQVYSYSAYIPSSNLFAGPDDDSCTLITNYAYINNVAYNQTDIYVIDASGDYTWYRLSNLSAAITSILPFGRNKFLITFGDGTTFWFSPNNAKLNNPTPIWVFPASGQLGIVCGQNFQNIFYDPVLNILIAGYYYPAGQYGTFINSLAYNVNKNGSLNQIASGYAGYADPPNTPDPFNQTGGSGGAGIGTSWIQTNGVTSGYGSPQQDYIALARSSYLVSPGGDNGILCPNDPGFPPPSNNAYVRSRTSDYLYTLAPWQPYYTDTTVYPSDTSIDGLLFLSVLDNLGFIAQGDNVLYFGTNNYVPNPAWSYFQSMAMTSKYLFGQYFTGNQGGTSSTIISVSANPQISNGGKVYRQSYATVNSVRPISLTGAYKS